MHLEKTLSKLISFPTVSGDQEENKKALDWIRNSVGDLPLYFKEFKSDGHRSLLITTRRTKKMKIMLAAHLDVVPAPPESFHPRRVRDRLYGRGACDMKFAIACYLRLLHELKALNAYDLGVMITTDEEIGGHNGTAHILSKGYSADVVLLPDAGFDWRLESESKGVMALEALSKGRSAHSARPWEGESAIDNLMSFLEELKSLFRKEPCGSEHHHHDTMNIGKIEGGKAMNQVSNRAIAWIDVRHMPKTDKAKLLNKMLRVKKKYPKISLKQVVSGAVCISDPRAPQIKLFRDIAKNRYGIETQVRLAHGASDARFFNQKKMPTLVLRPKAGANHTSREWVSLKDLDRFYEVMKEWVMELHSGRD